MINLEVPHKSYLFKVAYILECFNKYKTRQFEKLSVLKPKESNEK